MPIDTDRTLIREAIAKLRLKLLDLTNRNRLLNFKFSETSKKFVRVVDEVPNVLFERLSEGGPNKRMYFTGLPTPPMSEEAIAQEAELPFDEHRTTTGRGRPRQSKLDLVTWAQTCGVNPSFDLPELPAGSRPRHTDNQIQLLLLRETMERKLAALREDANLAQQESGVSTLFVAFGFLEWFEDDLANTSQYAPLLLLPVTIGRELKNHTYRYYLEGSEGSDAVDNISLRERLKDAAVAIPKVADDDDPETYLAKVARAISRKPRWKVLRQVVIGHFSFARLAMYEDLGEARWEDAPLEQQELLRDLLSGKATPDADSNSDTLDVDDPNVEVSAPVLVTDADSSQFSAIVDAMRGRSFALKGPPGTGKSQTITNLIANLLFAGKKVLFVAEKLAALEVVSKRLADANLDPFILELHSAKAQKKQVLASFEYRLNLRHGSANRPTDATIRQLRETRSRLKTYVEALNTKIGNSELSLHDVYWLEQRARRCASRAIQGAISEFEDKVAPLLTPHDVTIRREIVSRFVQTYLEATEDGPISAHELYGIDKPGTGANARDELRAALRAWNDDLTKLESVVGRAETIFKAPLPKSLTQLNTLVELSGRVPTVSEDVLLDRLQHCSTLEATGHLLLTADLIEKREESRRAADQYWTDVSLAATSSADAEKHLLTLGDSAVLAGLGSVPIRELAQSARIRSEKLRSLQSTLELIDRARGPEAPPLSLLSIAPVCEAVEDLRQLPLEALTYRHDALVHAPNGEQLLREAAESADRLSSTLQAIVATSRLSTAPSGTLRRAAATLRSGGMLAGIFSSEFRAAKRSAREISHDRKAGPAVLADVLERQADYLEGKAILEGDENLKNLCGEHFRGVATDFRGLAQACSFVQATCARYPSIDPSREPARLMLLSLPAALLRDLANAVPATAASELARLPIDASSHERTSSAKSWLQRQILETSETERLADKVTDSGLKRDVAADHLRRAWTSLQHWIACDERATQAGITDADLQIDAATRARQLRATVAFAKSVLQLNLPPDLRNRLLSRNAPAASAALIQVRSLLKQALSNQSAALQSLKEKFGLVAEHWLPNQDPNQVQISVLTARLERAIAASDARFSDWMILRGLFQEARTLGVDPVLDAVWSGRFAPSDAWTLVELAYLHRLIREAESAWPDLPTWTGSKMENLRARLKDLDLKYIKESQARIAHSLIERPIPAGVSSGAAGEFTEKALILREAGKQRRHISLRDLLRRAEGAASALKPCYMMSPASVSQYLPAVRDSFDVVIIDEASQMRPEDAIAAAARAKQIIVVGDPKQLPPSTFFDSVREAEEEVNEAEADVELESILDLALGSFSPARDLRWHYRSRHQSLIEFSNAEFYDRRLIIFPSPSSHVGRLGVSQVFVADGAYASSVNITEADHVVATVAQLMRDCPGCSIGVVSLNQPQLEILKEKFDQAFALDENLEDYRAKWSGTLEPFFAKNLENVQGDERDIIVISTVYGPETPGGPVAQRFGPINQKVGHRRLNVLFTRAKERVIVVTSMRPEDIRLGGSSSRGVAALKSYLEYSRSGRLEIGQVTGASVESPFEAEVKELLLDLGFKVECQVGVAGFFIDLAVRHPVRSDHFMLGIECDGASYHSSASARDRDRLRQEILERLQWKLHRIWSTDWFRNRDREVSRLKEVLERATRAQI